MAENREEILSQLYALRGSISYMSERTQPVSEKEEQKTKDITHARYLLEYHINNPSYYSNLIEKTRKKIESTLSYKKEIEKSRTIKRTLLTTIILGLLTTIILPFIFGTDSDVLLTACLIVGGILFAAGIIIWICFNVDDPSGPKKAIQEYEDSIKRFSESDRLIAEGKADLEKKVAELESIKDEKAELAEELRPVYYATVDAYSDMIDERDWEYLDVVIYYFETKRADSIKEALQLVDRMVQTNMIISAVETASKDIQNCIYNACRVLAGTITAACNKICAGLGAVVSAVDMQNALYEQSNRTSSQMAADIKYIKEKTDKISKNRN